MQCPICKNDGVYEDALMCPHCMRQIREMTDEEREVIRKEEKDVIKGTLISGAVSLLFIAIILGPLFFVLIS